MPRGSGSSMPGVSGACWCVAEATFTSLGMQSPAPRAAPPAEAEKRDAGSTLTSCVLPSRATDVLNPAMRCC